MKPVTVEGGERKGVSLDGLFAAAGWLAVLLGLVSVVGRRIWPIELITNFWPQLAVTLLCFSVLAAFFGARRRSAAHGAGALVLVVLIAPILRFDAPPLSTSPSLIVMFANVERSNTEFSKLVEAVRVETPDIVALAEVDEVWLEALEELRAEYPYQIAFPRDDNFGSALLSRVPLSESSVEFVGPSGPPSIFATVEDDSGPWRVVVTHPIPPFSAFEFDSRNQQLAELSEEIAGSSLLVVLLGDLNATLWSPFLSEFRRTSGLESASSGLRALYTWPVGLPLLALGLDHCLHSEAALPRGFRVLRSFGSDHFPILCSFSRS
jgi:endonuclease/exonuclease/phosphatase (EEP) superfamily protein YafD